MSIVSFLGKFEHEKHPIAFLLPEKGSEFEAASKALDAELERLNEKYPGGEFSEDAFPFIVLEYATKLSYATYNRGFKAGAQLMMEVFRGTEKAPEWFEVLVAEMIQEGDLGDD